MKERSIKELLSVLYHSIEANNDFDRGMCKTITDLWLERDISGHESRILGWYLEHNKPPHYVPGMLYWWPVGEKQPRLDWLKEHIDRHE